MSGVLQHVQSYLPAADGLLPKWLLFISVVAFGNSIQSYISLAGTQQVYSGTGAKSAKSGSKASSSPATPLSARTFGTWTILSGIVRFYAAYNIHDPRLYELCFATFLVVTFHFGTEWFVYGTVKFSRGLFGPLFVTSLTIPWMLSQWDYYVK